MNDRTLRTHVHDTTKYMPTDDRSYHDYTCPQRHGAQLRPIYNRLSTVAFTSGMMRGQTSLPEHLAQQLLLFTGIRHEKSDRRVQR